MSKLDHVRELLPEFTINKCHDYLGLYIAKRHRTHIPLFLNKNPSTIAYKVRKVWEDMGYETP